MFNGCMVEEVNVLFFTPPRNPRFRSSRKGRTLFFTHFVKAGRGDFLSISFRNNARQLKALPSSAACIPCSVPVKELKLLAPPPANPCYTCFFHCLVSFDLFLLLLFSGQSINVFETIAGAVRKRARKKFFI